MKHQLLFITLFGILHSSYAQRMNNADRLSLQQAINIALEKNLGLKILKNNIESSAISNDLSFAGSAPAISASATNNRTLTNLNQELSNGIKIQRNNITNNSVNLSIAGTYTLYNGLRVQYAHQRLQKVQQQNETLLNAQVQNLIAEVTTRYYDIVRQQGYITTLIEALQVTLQRKKLIETKQLVGLANNADTYQAMMDSIAGIQEIVAQRNTIELGKADLLNLLVLKPDSTITVADTIVVDQSLQIDSIKKRINLNPELLSAEQQVEINDLMTREIGAQRYPSVQLNGGYSFNRNKNGAGFTLLNQIYGPFVGLGINVPIFNGGLLKKQERIANINSLNAKLTAQQTLNNLTSQLAKTYTTYKNNLEQLKTEKENNKTAAALLDLVYKRYELGVGTIIDLRVAQQSYVESGFRLLNLSYAAKIAEIELKRLGSILK